MAKNDTGATKHDIVALKQEINKQRDEIIDHFDTTADRLIKQYSDKFDAVLKQYAKTEEANEILTHKVYQDHEPRITTLEVRDKMKS